MSNTAALTVPCPNCGAPVRCFAEHVEALSEYHDQYSCSRAAVKEFERQVRRDSNPPSVSWPTLKDQRRG